MLNKFEKWCVIFAIQYMIGRGLYNNIYFLVTTYVLYSDKHRSFTRWPKVVDKQ